ncbi:MAG: serine/threonine protein kinase [Polyangiaceae bacterium]|nr:serine/threonine protein kinase [Polyangiaceae bacterium]
MISDPVPPAAPLPPGGRPPAGDAGAESAPAPSVFDVTRWNPDEAVRCAAHRELAPEVLRLAAARIRAIAEVSAGVFFAYLVAWIGLGPGRVTATPGTVGLLLASGAALSVGMAVVGRLGRLRPEHATDLGYTFLFGLCFLLGVLRHLEPWPAFEAVRSWSLVSVPILAFGALVPATPRRALPTLLGAAAMDPLALILLRQGTFPPAPDFVFLLASPILGALMAAAVSAVVFQLSERVAVARKVGSYRLVERLGVGGMAEVWRASHHLLARPAAVKLIRRSVLVDHGPHDAGRLVRLFAREARTTASLRSPHTIQIYDFGVTPDGAFYYVMELLDGLDFQSLVERFGPLPPERVAALLRQACHSLDEAHSRNFVHRDLKPANVFTCHYGNDHDFVKVLDFGLVLDRVPTPEELEDERRFVGTPAVMAPEMVRFRAPVDARTDVYALGCVAYWLLTGMRVFDAATRHDMMVMHAHQRPLLPSRRVERPIHTGLEALVMQCLEKNPNRRPQSAVELADALDGLEFQPPWGRERAALWWRTHHPTGEPHEADQSTRDEVSPGGDYPAARSR